MNLFLEVDEDRHMIFDQLRGQADGEFRRDAAVGPDLEQQLVVIGVLPQPRGLDMEVDLGDRGMNRIYWDVTDRQIVIEIAVGRDVTTPALDPHLDVGVSALVQRGDVYVVGRAPQRPHPARCRPTSSPRVRSATRGLSSPRWYGV